MYVKEGFVKYSAGTKTFPSKYSDIPQQSMLIQMDDGTEERIYFDQGRKPHADLQRNERVQIVYSTNKQGKRIRQLVAHPSRGNVGMVAPSYTTPEPMSNSMSPQDFIQQKLDIFEAVFQIVDRRFEGFSVEDLRSITTSILIEGDRKNIKFADLLKADEFKASEDENWGYKYDDNPQEELF